MIDDESDLARMTQEYFQMFGVSMAIEETIAGGLSFLENNRVDILLLDINLAGESGFTMCKKIREKWDIPILFVSARQSDDDVLIALNIGGDDYIKKPYSLSVLLAKVNVILKRISGKESAQGKKVQKQEELSLWEDKLSVCYRGQEISLKAKEFALLKCLYEHRGSIVTKEKIFERVWGDAFYSDGTLNVHIRKLREKLEENPNEPKLIKTVWGTGYILECEK